MKVRISYSVDLKEVPQESSRMITECSDDLEIVTDLLKDIANDLVEGSIDQQVFNETIGKCRNFLAKADARLSDNSSIVNGYFEAKQQVLEQLQLEKETTQQEEKIQKKAELEKAIEEL